MRAGHARRSVRSEAGHAPLSASQMGAQIASYEYYDILNHAKKLVIVNLVLTSADLALQSRVEGSSLSKPTYIVYIHNHNIQLAKVHLPHIKPPAIPAPSTGSG